MNDGKIQKKYLAWGVLFGILAQGVLESLFAIFDYFLPTTDIIFRRAFPSLITAIIIWLGFRELLS